MSTAITSVAVRHLGEARGFSERDATVSPDGAAQSGSLGRGLLFALPISGLLWIGIIAAFRAIL